MRGRHTEHRLAPSAHGLKSGHSVFVNPILCAAVQASDNRHLGSFSLFVGDCVSKKFIIAQVLNGGMCQGNKWGYL